MTKDKTSKSDFSSWSCVVWRPAPKAKRGSTGAFSLVEVTLALMVVSVGVLTVMGLFVVGSDQQTSAIDDAVATFFAEATFNTLMAESERSWRSITDLNEYLQGDIPDWATTNLVTVADTTWANPLELDVVMDGQIRTNKYRLEENENMENHAFRYAMTVERKSRCIKQATLRVYPGEFGSTNSPKVFVINIFNYQLDRP